MFDVRVILGLGLVALLTISSYNPEIPSKNKTTEAPKQSKTLFGFNIDNYIIDEYPIHQNQFLSNVLSYEGIKFEKIVQLENNSKDIFHTRNFKAGKSFHLIREDECADPVCMIYEPDAFSYVQYFFNEKATVRKVQKQVDKITKTASGEITGSLWDAMISQDLSPALIDKMEDALSSSVDFYHTKKGDKFYLIFEEQFVEGKKVGVGDLLGASYENDNGKHYAVYFENERYQGHYDMDGSPTKRKFLRAPLKYSRISSRFNRKRHHPIKKKTIPHLGTDYAAPHGTPIFSVADGVVQRVSYTKGNGKYVHIKHDKTYETKYFHMSGYAKGIKKGVRVKQGQTIGYVGQTGLATGPHVCFRFWKNGQQINHLRENFPPADPLPESDMEEFYKTRDEIKAALDLIPDPNPRETVALLAE